MPPLCLGFRLLSDVCKNCWSPSARRCKLLPIFASIVLRTVADVLTIVVRRLRIYMYIFGLPTLSFPSVCKSIVSLREMTSAEPFELYKRRDNIGKCFESGKMGFKMDTARAHRQDTMEGRFVVAFVALSILAELKSQLAKRRKVMLDNRIGFVYGRRTSGYFLVKDIKGNVLSNGVSYKKLKLIQKRRNFIVDRRDANH